MAHVIVRVGKNIIESVSARVDLVN